jgi:GntR family transcriptional regulator, transcriptional repressor for pyruvate dehydrogenase complex
MLEANGLIEVRVGARGGAFVTAPAPKLVGEGLADMLLLATDVDPADVTEARMVFELGMLDLACVRATPDDLAELREICDRTEAGGYDPALSAEFHTRLARCTHNAALALFAESFQAPLASSLRRARAADPRAGRAAAREHRAIVDAIAGGDAARAREIMSAHIGRTAARVAVESGS